MSTYSFPIEKSNKKFTTKMVKKIGEDLGIDWSVWDVEQFLMGCDVELEHGKVNPATNVTEDDPVTTFKIAWAHLNEDSHYYTLLKEMEKKFDSKD